MIDFRYLLAGIVGGVLGGMGFGGGTLLIPILVFLLGVSYELAAWVNLVAFLPTAVVALVVHCKNKLLDRRAVLIVLGFALIGVAVGLFLVKKLSESSMRFAFGVFLISLGSISLFSLLFGFFKKNEK